jgi:hypothetical protein
LPMITKGFQSINLVENPAGMCCFMLLLLAAASIERNTDWF